MRGIVHDREWMVVNEADQFITQREIHKMCLVKPILNETNGNLSLSLSAPGMSPIEVPATDAHGQRRVKVWSATCRADDQGDEAAKWLSEFLGTKCRLVRMSPDYKRQCDQRYAKRKTDQTGFADDFPVLLISEDSLVDLNNRLSEKILMNRFRPNIVVTGCGAFAEDKWNTVRIGEVVFDVVKPCARCVVTTVDQANAQAGVEPLKTLATYRNSKQKLLFGQKPNPSRPRQNQSRRRPRSARLMIQPLFLGLMFDALYSCGIHTTSA